MNKKKRIQKLVMIGVFAVIPMLGIGCGKQTTQTQQQNTNAEVSVDTNNGNASAQDEQIDTSDWQTYTNDEYGFSLKYPKDWTINGSELKNVRVVVSAFSEMPDQNSSSPNTQVSPELKDENIQEQSALQENKESNFGGTLVTFNNYSFFKYIGYIENGTIEIEYVVFINNHKISLQYLEGDNNDYVQELKNLNRSELLAEYQNNTLKNSALKERSTIFNTIMSTIKFE